MSGKSTNEMDQNSEEVFESDEKVTPPMTSELPWQPVKAYTAITIMMLLYVTKNWQQATLSYFYGFQGVGDKFRNPFYEMSAAFPQLDLYYGMLSGMIFDIPYSISGLLASGFS